MTATPRTRPGTAAPGPTWAPARGIPAGGRARSGWTACWSWTRPPCVARVRRSTAPASTASSPRRAASRAGDRSEGDLLGQQPLAPALAGEQAAELHRVQFELVAVGTGRPAAPGRPGEPQPVGPAVPRRPLRDDVGDEHPVVVGRQVRLPARGQAAVG